MQGGPVEPLKASEVEQWLLSIPLDAPAAEEEEEEEGRGSKRAAEEQLSSEAKREKRG